jgi:hypothetical protein
MASLYRVHFPSCLTPSWVQTFGSLDEDDEYIFTEEDWVKIPVILTETGGLYEGEGFFTSTKKVELVDEVVKVPLPELIYLLILNSKEILERANQAYARWHSGPGRCFFADWTVKHGSPAAMDKVGKETYYNTSPSINGIAEWAEKGFLTGFTKGTTVMDTIYGLDFSYRLGCARLKITDLEWETTGGTGVSGEGVSGETWAYTISVNQLEQLYRKTIPDKYITESTSGGDDGDLRVPVYIVIRWRIEVAFLKLIQSYNIDTPTDEVLTREEARIATFFTNLVDNDNCLKMLQNIQNDYRCDFEKIQDKVDALQTKIDACCNKSSSKSRSKRGR